MTCTTCSKPLGKGNKTGLCQTCCRFVKRPGHGKRISDAIARKMMLEPEYKDVLRERAHCSIAAKTFRPIRCGISVRSKRHE